MTDSNTLRRSYANTGMKSEVLSGFLDFEARCLKCGARYVNESVLVVCELISDHANDCQKVSRK